MDLRNIPLLPSKVTLEEIDKHKGAWILGFVAFIAVCFAYSSWHTTNKLEEYYQQKEKDCMREKVGIQHSYDSLRNVMLQQSEVGMENAKRSYDSLLRANFERDIKKALNNEK